MRSAIVLLALGSIPAVARGQTCMGQTSYASGSIKAAAGVEFGGNHETGFWGGAGIGRPRSWFAGGSAGIISGTGQSSFGLAGMGGLELKKPLVGKLEVCPMAGIHHQFGDMGFTDFIAAASAAYPLGSPSANTRLMLVGGYQGIYERYSITVGNAEEWYGNLDLGVGLLFDRRFSVVPQVRIPIRYGGGRDVSFIVRGSVNLGGK
jgi:hypothetical protein